MKTKLQKLVVGLGVAAALFGASQAATAGYTVWGPYGPVYVPTCVPTYWGPACG